MSVSIDQLSDHPFSFYPPIALIDHNEWVYRKATWSEVLVMNTRSRNEIWIPRHFLGDVSQVDSPVTIVGLRKELEYRAGAVWPRVRRVIEMPRAVNDPLPRRVDVTEAEPRPAPVVGIKLEPSTESRAGRLVVMALVLGVVGCVLGVSLIRLANTRVTYRAVLQSDLEFTGADDYQAVVRRWGAPAADRWRPGSGAMEYRALHYPQQRVSLILMGADRKDARYIGAMNDRWQPVHSVALPGGGNTAAMLRGLKRF